MCIVDYGSYDLQFYDINKRRGSNYLGPYKKRTSRDIGHVRFVPYLLYTHSASGINRIFKTDVHLS